MALAFFKFLFRLHQNQAGVKVTPAVIQAGVSSSSASSQGQTLRPSAVLTRSALCSRCVGAQSERSAVMLEVILVDGVRLLLSAPVQSDTDCSSGGGR